MRNRAQKNIYKKLVIHLSQQNRILDLARDQKTRLEVQAAEVKLATCLQVVLNAGWSITQDNWEHFLEVSGVTEVRYFYWEAYNEQREQILHRMHQKKNVVEFANKAETQKVAAAEKDNDREIINEPKSHNNFFRQNSIRDFDKPDPSKF